jgi:hypothetical protein
MTITPGSAILMLEILLELIENDLNSSRWEAHALVCQP